MAKPKAAAATPVVTPSLSPQPTLLPCPTCGATVLRTLRRDGTVTGQPPALWPVFGGVHRCGALDVQGEHALRPCTFPLAVPAGHTCGRTVYVAPDEDPTQPVLCALHAREQTRPRLEEMPYAV